MMTLKIALMILVMLVVIVMYPKPATAQSSCSSPSGGCNYEVTTNGVTPSYVNAWAVINTTMTVQSYSSKVTELSLQYNPDVNMVCDPFIGSTGNWVQAAIIYGVSSGYPGGPGSTGILYLRVEVWNSCTFSPQLLWSGGPNPISNVPWPLASLSQWAIGYNVSSNGMISQVCESM